MASALDAMPDHGENPHPPPTPATADEAWRRVRKPYTITKSRESWSEPEHDKFLEALQLFDRDWKKIEAFVGTKTVIQIRSHAQKYFMKAQKNGTGEHLPPPRPKKKAAHPYPQKAPKNALTVPRGGTVDQFSSNLLVQGCATSDDTSAFKRNSWEADFVPPTITCRTEDGGPMGMSASSCSADSVSENWPISEPAEENTQVPSLHIMPDFTQVYSFLATLFDPNSSGHMQKLKELDPIDVQTVLLLMRNLAANLNSPDFEVHRRILSSYNSETQEVQLSGTQLHQSSSSQNIQFMVMSK